MSAIANRAWYLAKWVNCMTPVQSPAAHTPTATATVLVDPDMRAGGIRVNPDRLQADVVAARAAADGYDQGLPAQRGAVVEGEHRLLAVARDALRMGARADRDAVALQGLEQQLRDALV